MWCHAGNAGELVKQVYGPVDASLVCVILDVEEFVQCAGDEADCFLAVWVFGAGGQVVLSGLRVERGDKKSVTVL